MQHSDPGVLFLLYFIDFVFFYHKLMLSSSYKLQWPSLLPSASADGSYVVLFILALAKNNSATLSFQNNTNQDWDD